MARIQLVVEHEAHGVLVAQRVVPEEEVDRFFIASRRSDVIARSAAARGQSMGAAAPSEITPQDVVEGLLDQICATAINVVTTVERQVAREEAEAKVKPPAFGIRPAREKAEPIVPLGETSRLSLAEG